ncbi:MAG TPA: CHAD domain-containing protein [Acidimicrobiales bacterium]|nr:CHAD domain-containing protein [Acidimicrobiales bacterium]
MARASKKSRRSEPSAAEVVRDFLGRGVGNLLRYDPVVRRRSDPEGLHQMRVNVRHLRSEMKVVDPILRRSDHQSLDRDLKWLGAEMGALRDLDVLGALFASGASAKAPTPQIVVDTIAAQRAKEAARLTTTLRSKRYRRLMERLSDTVVDPPLRPGASAPASNVLGPGLRVVASDLVNAIEQLGPSPSPNELHQVRIKVKRCRYNCELAEDFVPSAQRAAEVLEKVQTVLGDLHDHVVARQYVSAVVRPGELFGGPAPDGATVATTAWLDASIARLSAAWQSPVASALDALTAVLGDSHISSSEAPDVPVK